MTHLRTLIPTIILMALTAPPGCGGKVVVDAASTTNGEGGAGGNATFPNPPLVCGQDPTTGKTVIVCVSIMQGDFCPPASNNPDLVKTLADAMGVCAETTPTACCNKAAIRQAICDLAPNGNECCYTAHYFENVVCE